MKIKDLIRDPRYIIILLGALSASVFIFSVSNLLFKIVTFLVLCVICGIMVFINYVMGIPFDFTPVFFLSIIITSTLGVGLSIVFIIVGGIIPTVIAGGKIDVSYLVFLTLLILLNLFSSSFSNIMVGGIILAFIYSVVGGVISIGLGDPVFKQVPSMIVNIIINTLYFYKFSEMVIHLLS